MNGFDGQLIIKCENGQLSVIGPIEHPMLCYALLEAARDAVFFKALQNAQAQQAIVQPPPGFDPKTRM